MKVIDAGHEYELQSFDGEQSNHLVFMKREGEGYPFNVGHHAGTNCQEVLRALIDRVKYLQKQIPCDENYGLLTHLRGALVCLEYRAARRHGRVLHIPSESALEVEDYPTCIGCGHIQCEGNCKRLQSPSYHTDAMGQTLRPNHGITGTLQPSTPSVGAIEAAVDEIYNLDLPRSGKAAVAAIITKHLNGDHK